MSQGNEDMEKTDARKYDVFLIYSSKDSVVAHEVEKELKEIEKEVCMHERDFIPGVSVIKNICTAINESRKYVVIISNNVSATGVFDYEADMCLFNSVVMRKEGAVILLVTDDKASIPQKFQIYQPLYRSDEHWVKKLTDAINKQITIGKVDIPTENDYHVVSVSHIDSEFFRSLIRDALSDLEKKVKRLKKIGIAKHNADENESYRLRYAKDDSTEQAISYIEVMEKVVDITSQSTTVLVFWICQKFLDDEICTDFLASTLLSLKDKPISPVIIPVLPKDSTPIDSIKDISCLLVGHEGTEGEKDIQTRIMETVAIADFLKESSKKSVTEFVARIGREMFRVAEIEGAFGDDTKPDSPRKDADSPRKEAGSPRYLGVSFTGDGHLLLLDADNSCLKKVTILGRPVKKLQFDHMPNRLSRIDDKHVALIYRNMSTILIIDTTKMEIEECRKIKDEHGKETILKGITALDKDTMVVTANGDKCSLNIALVRNTTNLKQIATDPDGIEFSMPRQLTKVDNRTVAVADENDRRLAIVEVQFDSNDISTLKVVFAQDRWNEYLYNVRGLTADLETVYVAACNGVNTFDVKTKKLSDKPLIAFRSDVRHTRALALYSSPSGRKYLAVSIAHQTVSLAVKDIIKVFDITT